MTSIKCAICKKEYPMRELKLDKSQNFLVCNGCYNKMQSSMKDGNKQSNQNSQKTAFNMNSAPKEQAKKINFSESNYGDNYNTKPKNGPGLFSKIKSFFSSSKNDDYYDLKEKSMKINDDIDAVKRKGPLIVKEEPIYKKNKTAVREDKVKYQCNKCRQKFKLKNNTRIKTCPLCGSKEIERYRELDADTLLSSISDRD